MSPFADFPQDFEPGGRGRFGPGGVGRQPVVDPITQQTHHTRHVLVAQHAEHRPGFREEAHARKVLVEHASGLWDSWATSRTARPGMTWKRPGSSTSMKPWRMACIGTGEMSRTASQAAITAAAH